ncbi:MAG: hypothetical protein M3144_12655, partial [Actinomycetota bacterium]|nr:hypothetical protein [Actinomycetota bacterium]
MSVVAAAEQRQLVTRHVLYITSEGMARLVPLEGEDVVAVGPGCLRLRCAGSEMTASVRLERRDSAPDAPAEPWRVCQQAEWQLPSGRLALSNLEGLVAWFPDLGLDAGSWHVRVSVTGSEAANTLEDAMYEDAGELVVEDDMVSAERWLVQLW